MNDPMIIAAAFVLVIAASGSWIVQIINAKAAADDRKEAKAMRLKLHESATSTEKKADRIIEQGVEIHTLTNSNLSKVTAELVTALAMIKNLERMIASQDKAKDVADNLATSRKTDKIEEPKILEVAKQEPETKDLKGKK